MKFTAVVALLLPAAMAAPATTVGETGVAKRQTAVTDQLLFSISLPSFSTRRRNRDPATLDWSSDNCSWSPDNPAGYPFEPGCHRHDFGYRNYKAQGRFTDANKLRIDNNFLADLRYQCAGQTWEAACRGLALVYYNAVRAFGREGARDRDHAASDEAFDAYVASVAEYNAEVKAVQARGGELQTIQA